MLDIMRKHASSWLIKVILGAIIVSFVFFFGYSSYRKGARGGRMGAESGVVAKVNGTPISAAEFEYFFNRNMERIKSNFKDTEVPEFARKLAQSSTLGQLTIRELALSEADSWGILVPDVELADFIRTAQSQGGEFDPIIYRHETLPAFKNHYGLDYEQFVRQDLRLSLLEGMFRNVDSPSLFANKPGGKETLWTFEVVTIDPKALTDSKSIKDASEAGDLAKKIIESKDWKKTIDKLTIDVKKIGPIKISERRNLMGGNGKFEDYEKIFALTKENPIIDKPIERGNKFYVLRLTDKTEKITGDKAPVPTVPGDFFETWLKKLESKAKVQSFLENK